MTDLVFPRSFPVLLPIGYTDAAGHRHRRGEIRKLRGSDEALFYDSALNGAALVTALIHRTLVRLEGMEQIEPVLIEQLYSADRNYLLYELRRITFGNRLRTSYLCPVCEQDVTLTEDLDTLPIRRLADDEVLAPIAVRLEDGFQDRRGTVHRELTLALPRGTDEAFVASLAERDLPAARDALLLRAIRQFGTLPMAELQAYGVRILQDLTMGDRRLLHQALNDAPGVEFQRSITCHTCGAAFETVLDVSDFFGVSSPAPIG
jgi:hypothetical protein